MKAGSGEADYETVHGALTLVDLDPDEAAGDVLFVVPGKEIAHRLVRATSPHNTFLVTERCDQLCVMCSQPPKQQHVDMFPYFEAAALLAPRGATLGISGGEPTLFKEQLLPLLERVLARRPDLRFHVLTNGQHFTEDDTETLRRLPADKVLWGIPLYAAVPELHDQIVAKPGAFARLMETMAILARAGAAIELRTVVMRTNEPFLPALGSFIASTLPFVSVWALMQLENIGFGRANWRELFLDSSTDFGSTGAAVSIALSRGINALLYNFPLCTVPPAYRSSAPATISDWKRKYLAVCDGCRLRERCGGFFEWYPEATGFKHVGML